jgi:hypothetical protein
MTRRQELLITWDNRLEEIAEQLRPLSTAETVEYERVRNNAQIEREWTAGKRSEMQELY